MGSPDRVGIAGMGAICALGGNLREIGANMHGARPKPVSAADIHPDAMPYPFFASSLGKRHFSARDTLNLALKAAGEAMDAAGWKDLNGAAVIVGTTSGTALHFLESHRAGTPGADWTDYLSCNTATALGSRYGATGPCVTLSNACVSGADAIGLGMDMINAGQVKRVLCGGADAFSLVAHTGFIRLKIYDEKLCRPFDQDRNGLNQGEAAAFLCLEKDPDHVLGYLCGYGSANDAWHLTAPEPEGRGLRSAIRAALDRAGVDAHELGFVNAHGTGTKTNDVVEGKVLHDMTPCVPLWASKGSTGHTLAAAGALEAVLSLLALNGHLVPASAGFENPDEQALASPGLRPVEVKSRFALSISLGFGGGNSALVLEGVR